jgi:hypothetical protein
MSALFVLIEDGLGRDYFLILSEGSAEGFGDELILFCNAFRGRKSGG